MLDNIFLIVFKKASGRVWTLIGFPSLLCGKRYPSSVSSNPLCCSNILLRSFDYFFFNYLPSMLKYFACSPSVPIALCVVVESCDRRLPPFLNNRAIKWSCCPATSFQIGRIDITKETLVTLINFFDDFCLILSNVSFFVFKNKVSMPGLPQQSHLVMPYIFRSSLFWSICCQTPVGFSH